MNRKQINIFLAAALSLILCSCESVRELSISYLKPAEVTFPPYVQSVALLNNITEEKNDPQIKGEKVTGQMAQQMADRQFFKEVIIEEELSKKKKLNSEEIRKKAGDMGADYAIVLEQIAPETEEKIEYKTQLGGYIGIIKYKVMPEISLINTINGYTIPICFSDSIFIGEEGSDRSSVEHLLKIDREHASEMVTGKLAMQMTDKLIPAWQTSGRILFIGNSPTMRDGSNYFDKKQWNRAVESWMKDYESGKKKLKFYAAANIALACEMADRYREAYEWVKKAEMEEKGAARYMPYIKFYRTDIEKRLKYSQRINSQMKRFKGNF